ncbi:MAG: polymer-forming cytoskeletal protein [Nitrospirae bacterium]|nr:MAG: polymer-forming cytoskeletal protein [Nitrospirota bacterium]
MSMVELEAPHTASKSGGEGYAESPQERNGGDSQFSQEQIVAFIGHGVEFTGTIHYNGSVRIDGRLDGEIHTEGTLLVGPQAVITAKISAGSVICKGQITGDIVAKEKVVLLASANMDGSLNTPHLSIEEGVVFNGTIQMRKSPDR